MKTTLKLAAIATGVLTATLLLSSTAFAHGYKGEANYKGEAAPCPPPERGLQGGFYLGGQVGYDSYRIRTNLNTGSFTANPAIAATGWVGGLFAGYGQYFNDFYYLAGEVLGNYSGASGNASYTVPALALNANSNVHVYGSWGLAVLPGIKLNNDSLLYARLGYDWARIKGNGNFAATIGGVPVSASGSNNQWTGGFTYGLGIETLLYQNWSMRTEVSHTGYNSFNNNLPAVGTVSVNPSDTQVMVGFIYHFA
jgi:opacity protein-like surface antigen